MIRTVTHRQWYADRVTNERGSGSNGSEVGAGSRCNLKRAGGSHHQANYITRLLEMNKKPRLYGNEIKPSALGENSFEKDMKQLAKLWPWGDSLCGTGSTEYFSRWKRCPFNEQMMILVKPIFSDLTQRMKMMGTWEPLRSCIKLFTPYYGFVRCCFIERNLSHCLRDWSSSQLHKLGFSLYSRLLRISLWSQKERCKANWVFKWLIITQSIKP